MALDDDSPHSGPAGDADRLPSFLVVGLGASAGGLEALTQFFSNMPTPNKMSFVVVTHQPPQKRSLMPELIAKHTEMAVVAVSSPVRVEPDRVYVAAGGQHLAFSEGVLHGIEPSPELPRNLPIDGLFRSLARDFDRHAVGIVFSGTGSDGTLGVKDIKGAAGMVMAQSEASAAFTGMPSSAIATRLVDYVLAADELPAKLRSYAEGRLVARFVPTSPEEPATPWLVQGLNLLRERTGQDFSDYKKTTVRRRIERRMSVHHLETPEQYVRHLNANPSELDVLFGELLIGVTSFFRDDEAFAKLFEPVLPGLLASRADDHAFRAWVPGCSTGEEAYSLAMLLRELMERLNRRFPVQIFATDLDAEAIDYARAGLYPAGIAADVGPERLERFFVRQGDQYRVRKEIREMLVFAPQNLIADPPFTKLDLLSCRNLLIYLDSAVQRRLVPIFHYALRPGGVLFLGSSENVGTSPTLFDTLDKRWKIFRRNEVGPNAYVAEFPASKRGDRRELRAETATRLHGRQPRISAAQRVLMQELVPPSLIVSEAGDIVHVHGRTGQVLEPATGAPAAANLFRMARDGLEIDLAAALRQAAKVASPVARHGIAVTSDAGTLSVDLKVRRLAQPEAFRGLFLVSFERITTADADADADAGPVAAATPAGSLDLDRFGELERELRYSKESLRTTIEDLETANEELKSTNEELQSTNEELQSANEELETSKEEMQSLNEELQTVNGELQGKVEQLSRTNDDMRNLLNGTDIATIFLDDQLRIKRYTEQAKALINLIPTDIGRPIGDLVSKLRYDRLAHDAREVLDTLAFKEVEVQGAEGKWYLMRVLPYRTTENVIEGLVVTFAETTRIKRLEETAAQLHGVLQASPTSVFAQDADLRYVWAYGPILGHRLDDALGKTDGDLFAAAEAQQLSAIKRRVLTTRIASAETVNVGIRGRTCTVHVYVEPMVNSGVTIGVVCVATELEQK